ncbi:protein LSM14 homolog car-1 isoform X8 [Bemisia tabaci]|uniref:protein LSM14 homolog car-1 isoform X8 n=1 Tax=Bemisia tabaci TaxID=7038 RepID=UPI0008F985FE|nr:PREDICTED: protein LSM14 homolog B isoform X8 [Bemisia tabaci]
MSGGMPELGSKISLISKADIRYEGKLFTVDATECTIALSEVRSFGTEDRETRCVVPAQPQIYDYILFRGSDIKDIRVLNTQPLNDPAIVQQVSAPPALSQPNYPAIQQHSGFSAHPMMGQAPGHGVYQNYNPMASDLIGGSSRSSTPAVGAPSRKSPSLDQNIQASNQQNRLNKSQSNQHHYRDNQGFNRGGYRDNYNRGELRDRDYRDNRDRDNFRENRDRGDFRDNRDRGDYRDYRDRNNYSGGQMLNRMPNAGRGWVQRGGVRQWGNGRGGRPQAYNNRPAGPLGPNQKPRNKIKFDKEYDFEQANSQFEELRSQLSKIKIDGEAAAVRVNGETDKKDDSGNETGIGEGETESEEAESAFYNKAKSFFDNISCEAIERSKGRLQRVDWRQERKLNSETFGVTRSWRGNFRGGNFRGYYPGAGYNNNYNRGGYHRQQNYNNRPQNSNRGALNSENRTEQKRPAAATAAAATTAPPPTPTTANTTAASD